VDGEAGQWVGQPGPRELWGLLAATAPPVAALDALLRTAARRLVGRRFTVPGTELTLRVETFDARPDSVGLAIGQLDDVRIVARDVQWRRLACERLVLVCRNVHLRPLPVPVLVSAPVEVELTVAAADLRQQVATLRPQLRVEVDGEARLRWAERPQWGALVVVPEVTDTALYLRPVALWCGSRRLPLPRWAPPLRVRVPALPRRLRLRGVEVRPDAVVVRLAADQWRETAPWDRLRIFRGWLDGLA
jgi:LmeA-like phospholipid-binding